MRGLAIISAPRRRFAAKSALVALALLVPVRSFDQLLYAASFALALLTFWLWGEALGRSVLGIARLRFFTAICLGQFAALAAAEVATGAAALPAHFFGMAPRLVFLAPAASLFLLFREIRNRRGVPAPAESLDLLTPFAIGCMAVAVATHSRHLASLGLDTHEHIAWVEQILRLGHVPMAEPGTNILADYPRTFHLMTALWTAAGLGLPAGPFVKLMPFLQNALAMLAIAEILEDAAVRRFGEQRRARFQVVLGAAFFVYAFLLVPLVYPAPDLSGTPRYSSGALLLVPAILLLLGAVERAPRPVAVALASAPLFGAWALTMNPIVAPLLVAVTLPACALILIFLKPPLAGIARLRTLGVAAAATALGMLVLVQDPWVASETAKRSPRVAAMLRKSGLVTFDEAARLGLATPREKSVRNARSTPPCSNRGCFERLTWNAARAAIELPVDAAEAAVRDAGAVVRRPSLPVLRHAFQQAMPLRLTALADYAALPFLAVVAGGALLALARAIGRRRKREASQATFSPDRFLAVALAVCALSGICLAFAGGLAAAFNDQTHEATILDQYLNWSPHHVSLALLWLPFAGACMALASPRQPLAADVSRVPSGLRAVALALWVALPLSARLNLHLLIRHPGFFTPAHLADVRALHDVERSIPPDDAVLIPAEHWNVAEWEHWVIPLGPTVSLLPYGERRYLFNVYLGASYPLSWRDLEDRLCSSDPAVRRAFLIKQHARWLLVKDADAETALTKQTMCGAPLSALGVQLPPARSEGGIYLFRLSGVP